MRFREEKSEIGKGEILSTVQKRKQKRIIQEWDAVDVESQSVKSAGQDMN